MVNFFTSAANVNPTSLSLSQVVARSQEVVLSSAPNIEDVFEEFLGLEVADGKASADTIRNYKSQVKLYLQWCLDTNTNPLTAVKRDIQAYRKYLLERSFAISTIELKLNVVRRFYDGAIEHGLLSSNPAKAVKAPLRRKNSTSGVKFLELEQMVALLELTEGNTLKLKRDRVLVGLMMLHGLRTIEVHQLNLGDISRQGKLQYVTVASKRSQRKIQLRSDFIVWLDCYLDRRSLDSKMPVIVSLSGNSRGKRLSRSGIRTIVNGYLDKLGVRGTDANRVRLSNHALRHTFATQVYAATKDLRLVQDALGHSSPQTTAKYAHLVDSVAAAEAIEL